MHSLFGNIDHSLLLKALAKHVKCRWAMCYIQRWLMAPLLHVDGTLEARTRGTPQGGIVSPVIANWFLHYTFDVWLTRSYPSNPWCRYADDGLVHCQTEQEAQAIRSVLEVRFAQCGLQMHPEKTKIVYCKDNSRKGAYPNTQLDFLGYTFRPRVVRNPKRNSLFIGFTPAVSKRAMLAMREATRKLNLRNRSDLSLADIARFHNPILSGWLAYYGRSCPTALYPVFRHFNQSLVAWARRKYKRLRHKIQASQFLKRISETQPYLFVHWRHGLMATLA